MINGEWLFLVDRSRRQFFYFWIRGNLTSRKVHFVGSGERVKPRLSQAFTRNACPDSNSRPVMQISSPLTSRHANY